MCVSSCCLKPSNRENNFLGEKKEAAHEKVVELVFLVLEEKHPRQTCMCSSSSSFGSELLLLQISPK